MYMKGNRELNDLLTSYILEELSAEDEAFVLEYIRSDESNRRHYEELRKTWKAITIRKGLEKVNEEEEWKFFEQRINRERQQLVAIKTDKPDKEIEADRIDGSEQGSDRKGIRKVLVAIAVAASVLAVVVFGRTLFAGKEKKSETVSVAVVAKTDEIKSELKKIFNKSGKPQRLLLSDGSEIVLADKSEISYAEPFASR